MKIRTEKIDFGEEEILIRYRKMTKEIVHIIRSLQEKEIKLIGKEGAESYLLKPEDIYYFESVDDVVFAYLKKESYHTAYTLGRLEEQLLHNGFIRCNKSFLLNVNHVQKLASIVGNRIDATLDNGEHVIVSRHYAGNFRAMLKGGKL